MEESPRGKVRSLATQAPETWARRAWEGLPHWRAASPAEQKGQEAGPAAGAAFREGGGSGEGFAVGRWLKVPGKALLRRSSS